MARGGHSLWPTCHRVISWIQVSGGMSPVTGDLLKTRSGGRSCEQVPAAGPCALFRAGGCRLAALGGLDWGLARPPAVPEAYSRSVGLLALIKVHRPPQTSALLVGGGAECLQPRPCCQAILRAQSAVSTHRPQLLAPLRTPRSRGTPPPPAPRPPEVSLSGSPAGRHTTRALLSWSLACSKLGIFRRQ